MGLRSTLDGCCGAIAGAVGAVLRYAHGGPARPETQAARRLICLACDGSGRRAKVCGSLGQVRDDGPRSTCGCLIGLKVMIAAEHCPRWPHDPTRYWGPEKEPSC